ncbi:MAG: glycosyltransferase family 4 protein [Chitinophagales bacterium]|nr:glycosyltransferase family 4 protein [Chitinophagales bacterium]
MKIGINTRFLLPTTLEGIGTYTHQITKRLVNLLPQHQFYFFFDRPFDEKFIYSNNIEPIIVSPPARHPFLWYYWFEKSIPKQLKKYNIDVFFSPDAYLSLATDVPQLLTIHDIAFEHFPKQNPWLVQQYYQYFVPKYIEKAKHIVTVSEFTKQDLIRQYKANANKISVCYNAFDEEDIVEKDKNILSKYNLKKQKYFIFIGAIHPRKNILNLLKAYQQYCNQTQKPKKLLLIGRKAWMNDEVNQFLQANSKLPIVWIQKIERSNLLYLLQQSYALLLVSFFEGFGIPIVEAQHFNIPSVVANNSALPEIAGNTAVYCEANNVESITKAMLTIASDEELYYQLKENCKVQKQRFSWQKSAAQIAMILEQIK